MATLVYIVRISNEAKLYLLYCCFVFLRADGLVIKGTVVTELSTGHFLVGAYNDVYSTRSVLITTRDNITYEFPAVGCNFGNSFNVDEKISGEPVLGSPSRMCYPTIDTSPFENKIIVADRGSCDFEAKGLLASMWNSSGIVILNLYTSAFDASCAHSSRCYEGVPADFPVVVTRENVPSEYLKDLIVNQQAVLLTIQRRGAGLGESCSSRSCSGSPVSMTCSGKCQCREPVYKKTGDDCLLVPGKTQEDLLTRLSCLGSVNIGASCSNRYLCKGFPWQYSGCSDSACVCSDGLEVLGGAGTAGAICGLETTTDSATTSAGTTPSDPPPWRLQWSSSVFNGQNASLAVDGDPSTCSVTGLEDVPWWVTNFTRTRVMLGVRILGAACAFDIRVGKYDKSRDFSLNDRCYQDTTGHILTGRAPVTVTCDKPVSGMYLSIQVVDYGCSLLRRQLRLCDVTVQFE